MINRRYFIPIVASYVKADTLNYFLTSLPLKESKDKFREVVQNRKDVCMFILKILDSKGKSVEYKTNVMCECAHIMINRNIKRQNIIDKMNKHLAMGMLEGMTSETHDKITTILLKYYPIHSFRIKFMGQSKILDKLQELANKHQYETCTNFLKKYPISSFDISDADIIDKYVKNHMKKICTETDKDLVDYLCEISTKGYKIFLHVFERFIFEKNNDFIRKMSKYVEIKHYMVEIALRAKNYDLVIYLSNLLRTSNQPPSP